jgi:hypothetical protein
MSTFEKLVAVSRPYLGPATEQFLKRQCLVYLGTEGDRLVQSQVAELSKGIQIAATRVMDESKAAELASKVARA